MTLKPATHSVIEKAKVLKAMKLLVSSEEFGRIKSIVSPGAHDETEQVIAGLSEEDEFALLCRLMGTATHLVPLNQSPIFRGDYIIPDFLARFQPGCFAGGWTQEDNSGFTCLVEVKSTEKNKFSIGGQYLQKRRNFAKAFNLPLIFAVRFLRFRDNALWIAVEDTDTAKSNLKITYSDLETSAHRVLWNDYYYMLFPEIHFQASYQSNVTGKNVRHPVYGEQFSFQIVTQNKRIIYENSDAFFYSMFFDAFGLEEKRVQRENDNTHVIYTTKVGCCSVADLIYKTNRLPINALGERSYDAAKLLAKLAAGDNPTIVSRQIIESLARHLLDENIIGVLVCGSRESNISTWRKYGGGK